MSGAQVDNHALGRKVKLRRHFLQKYGATTVFDCCQGSRAIWTTLLAELSGDVRYWGVDLKPQKGRLKIDSVRVLSSPGWAFDVIDIDVYGFPWHHWLTLLPNLRNACTVFLTIGLTNQTAMQGNANELRAMGITFDVPPTIGGQLHEDAIPYCLAVASQHGYNVVEAAEMPNLGGHARYFGVRLEPAGA